MRPVETPKIKDSGSRYWATCDSIAALGATVSQRGGAGTVTRKHNVTLFSRDVRKTKYVATLPSSLTYSQCAPGRGYSAPHQGARIEGLGLRRCGRGGDALSE